MENPLAKMTHRLPELDGANRRIASWYLNLLGSGSVPLEHSCNDVAQAVGVSRATVIRFARSLGYSGFPAFRNALIQSSASFSSHPPYEKEHLSALEIVVQRHVSALAASLQIIDPARFDQAVRWLAEAPTVLWVGWGDSFHVAASGEHKCCLGGMSARSLNDVAELQLRSIPLAAGSVIVVISQSGRWRALAEAIEPAAGRGARVICITGSGDSLLAQMADLTFVTSNPEYRVAEHPFTLRAAQLALIDALVLEAVKKIGKHSVKTPDS